MNRLKGKIIKTIEKMDSKDDLFFIFALVCKMTEDAKTEDVLNDIYALTNGGSET